MKKQEEHNSWGKPQADPWIKQQKADSWGNSWTSQKSNEWARPQADDWITQQKSKWAMQERDSWMKPKYS